MPKGGPGGPPLPEGKNRRELVAVGENDAGSQPVPRKRGEALCRELVVARGYQLPLLGGTPGAGKAQCPLYFFCRERRPALVLDVQNGGAFFHDQLDGDLVVAPAHDSAVLGLVVAVSVSVTESQHLKNGRNHRQSDLHSSFLRRVMKYPRTYGQADPDRRAHASHAGRARSVGRPAGGPPGSPREGS